MSRSPHRPSTRRKFPPKRSSPAPRLSIFPIPGSHDYRNALTFIPGVTPDAFGQPHVAGAETYQTLLLLDGFNVTQPTNGQLVVRTSVESFRSIEVTPSREPAEFGKGSGGVLALNTRMGDDHFRFTSTDFTPGLQTIKGISIGQWVPIYTMSGPIRKGKVWFIDALNGEYDNDIIQQLPSGSDRDHVWRVDNLAKLQSNLTTRNIVTVSFLSNYYHDEYDGLSVLQPQPTTPTDAETALHRFAQRPILFPRRRASRNRLRRGPVQRCADSARQWSVYPDNPGGRGQLLSERQNTSARRVQGLANLYFPPHQWHGRHDIKVGTDLDRLSYDSQFLRQSISFLQPDEPPPNQAPQPCATGADGVPVVPSICARYSVFSGGNYSTTHNLEASAYAEDRWLVTNRVLLEPGLRLDWDEIVRAPLFSPRLAGTYILDDEGNTKLSAGVGIIYDTTNLGLIDQPFNGQRVDYFFNSSGNPTDANGKADQRASTRADHVFCEPEQAGSATILELEHWPGEETASGRLSESRVPRKTRSAWFCLQHAEWSGGR